MEVWNSLVFLFTSFLHKSRLLTPSVQYLEIYCLVQKEHQNCKGIVFYFSPSIVQKAIKIIQQNFISENFSAFHGVHFIGIVKCVFT